jgi:hypothetical protein
MSTKHEWTKEDVQHAQHGDFQSWAMRVLEEDAKRRYLNILDDKNRGFCHDLLKWNPPLTEKMAYRLLCIDYEIGDRFNGSPAVDYFPQRVEEYVEQGRREGELFQTLREIGAEQFGTPVEVDAWH